MCIVFAFRPLSTLDVAFAPEGGLLFKSYVIGSGNNTHNTQTKARNFSLKCNTSSIEKMFYCRVGQFWRQNIIFVVDYYYRIHLRYIVLYLCYFAKFSMFHYYDKIIHRQTFVDVWYTGFEPPHLLLLTRIYICYKE